MSNINRCNPHSLLDISDLCSHGYTKLGIQIGKRLIKKQNTRLYYQRSCQCNSLLLSTGKLVCHTSFHATQFYKIQDLHNLVMDHLFIQLTKLQTICYIVKYIIVRKQCIALEYHRCITFVGRQFINRLISQIDFSLIRALKAGNHSKGCSLSTAGRSKQGNKAAWLDHQIGIIHSFKVFSCFRILIYFGNMLQTDSFGFFQHIIFPPLSFYLCQRTG